ncbi:MAG: hypothetical protein BAJATHORv1_20592 [Candidatus Thorarchaeota archaeon]|nr:MAG: hypothetical protein BAJATHORv1_20592 [Candidatus Thorarchaeota archaeon]
MSVVAATVGVIIIDTISIPSKVLMIRLLGLIAILSIYEIVCVFIDKQFI